MSLNLAVKLSHSAVSGTVQFTCSLPPMIILVSGDIKCIVCVLFFYCRAAILEEERRRSLETFSLHSLKLISYS